MELKKAFETMDKNKVWNVHFTHSIQPDITKPPIEKNRVYSLQELLGDWLGDCDLCPENDAPISCITLISVFDGQEIPVDGTVSFEALMAEAEKFFVGG